MLVYGRPAPYCADCAKVARTRPTSSDSDRIRAVAAEALAGVRGEMDFSEWADEGMRTFADLVDAGHEGTDERWSFSPRWGVLRALWRTLSDPDARETYRVLPEAEATAARARHGHQEQNRRQAAMADWLT